MEKLRKSFTDQKSPLQNKEEKQILLNPNDAVNTPMSTSTSTSSSRPANGTSTSSSSRPANGTDFGDRKEVFIKIVDAVGKETEITQQQEQPVNPIWRGPSYYFSLDAAAKGIGDFGFVTDSPSPQSTPLSKIPESPNPYGMLTPRDKEGIRVSFNDVVQRRSNASENSGGAAGGGGNSGEVVVCSGNASFWRKSTLLMMKSKSRLLDPPETDQRSQTLLMKSSVFGKSEIDDDNETC